MPTLQELRSQIADLEKQAAELHERESRAAITTVVELIQRYGLTADQIGLGAPPKAAREPRGAGRPVAPKSTRPGAGVPKFADPVSGKTWTGFGKPPAWIAGAKDRDAFRIDASAAAPRKTAAKEARTRKGTQRVA